MMHPRVVNLRQRSSWSQTLPEGVEPVRVDRATRWGNPFKMKNESERMLVIRDFAEHLAVLDLNDELEPLIAPLRTEVLACWCHPKPCHAHVLAWVADGLSPLEAFERVKAWAEKPPPGVPHEYANTVYFR